VSEGNGWERRNELVEGIMAQTWGSMPDKVKICGKLKKYK
jgi:hypothetical protein